MRLNVWVAISFAIFGAAVHTFAWQATLDPDRIQRGLLRDIRPSSIEELAKGAEVVLRGRLVKARTFLRNEMYIITQYEIVNPQIIAGALTVVASPKPDVGKPILLGVFGGEMTISGETIKAEDHAMATEITSGQEYLLFLRKFGAEPGQYQLYNGGIFEIQGNQAKALVKGAETVFKGASEAPVAELIDRVRGQGKSK